MPQPDCSSAGDVLTKLCIDAYDAYEAYVAHGTQEMRQIEASREATDEALGIKSEGTNEHDEETEGEAEDDVDRKEDAKGMELYAAFEKVRLTAKGVVLITLSPPSPPSGLEAPGREADCQTGPQEGKRVGQEVQGTA